MLSFRADETCHVVSAGFWAACIAPDPPDSTSHPSIAQGGHLCLEQAGQRQDLPAVAAPVGYARATPTRAAGWICLCFDFKHAMVIRLVQLTDVAALFQ